jgi:membrane associated rhomboid family serine protease
MGIFSDNIKPVLGRKDILIRLIVINTCVFLALAAVNIARLFNIDITDHIVSRIAVPAQLELLKMRFWTPATYMFVHERFFHILFNMLMLYWFGRIFLSYFNAKSLGSLYILGGLAGAALFVLAFNTVPVFVQMNDVPMIGASASVMAIIFAAAFYRPDTEVGLFFFGRIKIIYIALIIFILDFIGLSDTDNPGGHVAHIGGAIMGYVYAKQYLKGKDITRWVNKMMDFVVDLTRSGSKKKPVMKVKYKNMADYEYNQRKHNETEEIDRILDKLRASGYKSLSAAEKKRLFDAGNK